MIFIEKFVVGPLQVNSYLLTDEESGKSAIVDPGHADRHLLQALKTATNLSMILLTHCHFDHIGAADLIRRERNVPIIISDAEASMLKFPEMKLSSMFGDRISITADRTVNDGDEISLGTSTIKVIHTPGHTVGSVCFIVNEDTILSGDTLFRCNIGRTDFPSGDMPTILDSLKKLSLLKGDFTVLPGHGEPTLLSYERRANPYINGQSDYMSF